MFKKICILVFVICFFSSGCTLFNKKSEKKLFTNISKSTKPEKWQWKVKDGRNEIALQGGGIDLEFNFSQINLKDVVTLLMGSIKENFVIVDSLDGFVDVEINGKFKRKEVIKIVRTILNSKNFDLIKNGAVYGIYNRSVLEDSEIILESDADKNVYLYHLQYAKSIDLVDILTKIFPDISVTDNQNTNLLIIKSGIEEYKQVFKVIKRFDKRPKQVLVSFTIMEVTLSNGLQYGVEYFIRQQKKKGANISLLADGMASGFGNVVGNGLKAFSLRQELSSFITLLNSESKVDIISKPNLLVMDGSTSTINIGRDEPIRKGTSVGQNGQLSTDIQYRDVGVILSVSVTVEENNVVQLHLREEISDIIPPSQNPLIDSPSFTKNSIQLSTLLNDGQSIYIGGLIENSYTNSTKKIPILGDIPFIGNLFKSQNIAKSKTELILLLSVEILFNEQDFKNQRLKFVGSRNVN